MKKIRKTLAGIVALSMFASNAVYISAAEEVKNDAGSQTASEDAAGSSADLIVEESEIKLGDIYFDEIIDITDLTTLSLFLIEDTELTNDQKKAAGSYVNWCDALYISMFKPYRR